VPGCTASGYTKEEALQAIQAAAEAYIEDMGEAGEILPSERGRMGSIKAIFAGPSCAPSSGAATAPADGHAVPTALASPLLY
jgi:hypothetical protein